MRPSRRTRSLVLAGAALIGALASVIAAFALRTDAGAPRRADTAEPASGPAEPESTPLARTSATGDLRRELAPADDANSPPLRLEGRVLDDHGAPAAGAAVWITRLDSAAGATEAWTVARGDGTYALDVARRAGFVHACGVACGEAALAFEAAERATETRMRDLVLPRGGSIRGRVLDVHGRGAPYHGVQAWAEAGPVWTTSVDGHSITAGFRAAATGDDGAFVLPGLRACTHRIVLEATGWPTRWSATEALHVPPDADEVVFQVLPDGVLHGRVVDAETDAPIAAFTIDGVEHEDAEGRFETPFARGAPVLTTAAGYGYELWMQRPDDPVDAAPDVVFALHRATAPDTVASPPAGRVIVRAVDERGATVDGVRARNVYGRGTDRWLDEEFVASEPLARGRETVRALDRSRLIDVVAFDAPGHALVCVSLSKDRAVDQELDLVLERGAAVELRVLDSLGLAAGNARLEVDSARRKERDFAWIAPRFSPELVRSDSALVFGANQPTGRIEGLPAGAYTLLVHVDAERVESFPFEVELDELRAYEFRFPSR